MAIMSNMPLVSIVIPIRNEERFVRDCLESIITNDYPKDKLEIIVVDGMSEDNTRKIVRSYACRYPFIELLDNPKRIIPAAMNVGIQNATGEVIIKMDAHSHYPTNYVSQSVKYLMKYNPSNVGGIWEIVPGNNTLLAKAIAFSLSHSFGSGNAHYKTSASKDPRWADTVAFGCYRKEVFDRIGIYNENLIRSSDMDLNMRLRAAGGKILLVPEIVVYYHALPTIRSFGKHNFDDGFWVTYPLMFGCRVFHIRHIVPLVFLVSLIASGALSQVFPVFLWLFLGILGTYAVANLGSSLHISVKQRSPKYMFAMPVAFAARHIPYGLGLLYGVLKVLKSIRLGGTGSSR